MKINHVIFKKIKIILALSFIFCKISLNHYYSFDVKNKSLFGAKNKSFIDRSNSSSNKNILSMNKTKACICTLAKLENRYIREFIDHYKKYEVDKIFLYDNNDINGETFDEVISDYITNGFVEVFNWRGKNEPTYPILNDCYKKNFENYDWLLFYDIDEYIHLSNYSNVKDFLDEPKFKDCQLVHLNLLCHTDNNNIYYENKSLFERFPEIVPRSKIGGRKLEIKFILRGHIKNVVIDNIHRCNNWLRSCNGFGHIKTYNLIYTTEPDYNYYYIDHFYSKSTMEFIDKMNRGDAIHDTVKNKMFRINKYFAQSNITKEKIDLIENKTGLNISMYRNITEVKEIIIQF